MRYAEIRAKNPHLSDVPATAGAGQGAGTTSTGEPAASLWTIRPGRMEHADKDGDLGYVMRTWLGTYHDQPHMRWLPRSVYHAQYRPVVEEIVARSRVLVAADAGDPWHIVGFCVYELSPAVVHYVAVVERWRGKGCGSELLRAAGVEPDAHFAASHYSERAWRGRLVFQPSLLKPLLLRPRKESHAHDR